MICDARGTIAYANLPLCRMLGYQREDLIGKPYRFLLPSYRFPKRGPGPGPCPGQPSHCEGTGKSTCSALRKEGGEVAVDVFLSHLDLAGQTLVVACLHDMTRFRVLDEQMQMLTRAVEASPASVVLTDKDGVIGYVNPKFSEVTGYTAEEAIGRNPLILKSDKQSASSYKEIWETLLAGKEWHGEFCNQRLPGEPLLQLPSNLGYPPELGVDRLRDLVYLALLAHGARQRLPDPPCCV
jgi:PAS domain-containing protein